jgi:LacI family transcriptional regulator
VVLAARPPSGIEADCVLVDDFGGTRDATARLIDNGHTKIGFLGLPPSAWTGAERFRGFRAALEAAGLATDERYVRYQQRDIEAAERAARALLALPDPPTALFCANNRNTIGAFRAVNSTGANTALAGFDDFELADMLGLPLTVVAYDPAEVGNQAARLLLDRLARGSATQANQAAQAGQSTQTSKPAASQKPHRVVIPTSVVEYGTPTRGSRKPAPQRAAR